MNTFVLEFMFVYGHKIEIIYYTYSYTDSQHYCILATSAPSFAAFGPGTGPILLDDLACTGTETRLVDCPSAGLGVHNCVHSEDAGAVCAGE